MDDEARRARTQRRARWLVAVCFGFVAVGHLVTLLRGEGTTVTWLALGFSLVACVVPASELARDHRRRAGSGGPRGPV